MAWFLLKVSVYKAFALVSKAYTPSTSRYYSTQDSRLTSLMAKTFLSMDPAAPARVAYSVCLVGCGRWRLDESPVFRSKIYSTSRNSPISLMVH